MPSDAVVEGVSGAIGGIIATVATYPLMTITTRQVTSRTSTSTSTPSPAETQPLLKEGENEPTPTSATVKPPSKKLSTINEIVRTIRTSGFAALFPGLGASLIGTTVSQGVYFYLYSTLRQAAVRRRSSPTQSLLTDALTDTRSAEVTVAESLFVAALAGMGNVLLTNPIWMIATRMQAHQKRTTTASTSASTTTQRTISTSADNAQTSSTRTTSVSDNSTINALSKIEEGSKGGKDGPSHAPGPIAVAREVYSEYGLGGFWNGVAASLVMVINPTIQYAFYEWLVAARGRVKKNKNNNSKSSGRLSAGEVFLLSAIAKAGATVLTYPLLTVKTRMMSARKSDEHMQYTSIADAILQIARKEGLSGYYRGIQTKIVQSVLAAALLFMCKEKTTDFTRDLLTGRQKNAVVLSALVVQQTSAKINNNKALVR
jgi:solute carrier family 25 (peroxisomal adenine nucleotide transporter), member 17